MYKIDKEKVYWRRVEEETVVLNIDTGFYYTLNEIGSIVWNMMIQNQSEDEIVAKIIDGYDVSDSTAKKDIKALLRDLKRQDLIQPANLP